MVKHKFKPTNPQRLGIIIAGLILTTILCVVIIHQVRTSTTLSRVIHTRASNETTYDNNRLKRIATLENAGIISSTRPSYSSKIDACYITHDDQGWVAASWHQDCYIRYTDLFPISLSRGDVEQKLGMTSGVLDLFGKPNSFHKKICDTLYESDYKPTLTYVDLSLNAEDMGIDCKIAIPTQGTFTVRGPIVLDNELAIKSDRSYDINSVDKTKKYLSMQSDNYYYHEDLGCGIGILCPSPRSRPITGF